MAADDRSVGDGRKLIEGRVDDLPEEHGAARRPLDASAEIGSRKGSGFFHPDSRASGCCTFTRPTNWRRVFSSSYS